MISLHQVTADLGHELQKQKLMLATAESCTGGGLSYLLTSIPGSSNWFDRGFICYSNSAKLDMLEVEPLVLEEFGAVSEEAARQMAEGAIKNSEASVAVAITGIAGPGGGTADKPVGTVWLAWARNGATTRAHVDIYKGNREEIRLAAIETAVTTLLAWLKQE